MFLKKRGTFHKQIGPKKSSSRKVRPTKGIPSRRGVESQHGSRMPNKGQQESESPDKHYIRVYIYTHSIFGSFKYKPHHLLIKEVLQ
ncbi:hypothetical protein CEXT_333101 [Caerostris extrusa]|uniref:Uncharacterized protein n=1 Tax=Caerostris extrusa TaxID=172846 RepID=A0AAV4VGK4_CAEEX|nr:hypothetical protein CEXT_333101 [Caerostris extrusa]